MPKGKQTAADIADRRKDHSRTAAKSRRLFESEQFSELAETLPPIDQQTIYQLDRLAVLRLIITRFRLRKAASVYLSDSKVANSEFKIRKSEPELVRLDNQSIAQCVQGFIMVINKTGRVLFVTTSVADCLGFTQADLIGRHLRDYVDAQNWPRLLRLLCEIGKDKIEQHEIFFRMKTALTVRGGRARKLTVAVDEPLRAYVLEPQPTRPRGTKQESSGRRDEDIRLIYCLPFDLSSTRRASNESSSQEIITRHELDMKFRSCDENFAKMLDTANPKLYHRKSFYDLVHPSDLNIVCLCVKEMLTNVHSVSGYYRIMAQNETYIWIITEMMLFTQNIRGIYQKSVICKHTFLGTDNTESDIFAIIDSTSASTISTDIPFRDVALALDTFDNESLMSCNSINSLVPCNASLLQSFSEISVAPFQPSLGDPYLAPSPNRGDLALDNPMIAVPCQVDTDLGTSCLLEPGTSIDQCTSGSSIGSNGASTSYDYECHEENAALMHSIFCFHDN